MNFNDSSRRELIQQYFYLLEQQNCGTEARFPPELTISQEQELSLLKEYLSSARQDLCELEKRLSEPIPPFSLDRLCRYLPFSINLDLKKIRSSFTSLNKNEYFNKKEILVTVIFLSLILAVFLLFKIGRFIVAGLAISYSIAKFYSARHIYENDYNQNLNRESQAIKERIIALEQREQQLIAEIKELKEREINSTLLHLYSLEIQIKEKLKKDKKRLIQMGLEKLKISSSEVEDQQFESELDRDPIIFLSGVRNTEVSKNFILKSKEFDNYFNESNQELLIREEDFYEQKGLDGKYKYGVYEFVSIFLGENFLAYYRCYWNFIRGAAVDEETCEYLYDAIVSVKTKERSSLNQKNPDERRNYKQILSITTMDGKTISFQIGSDRKEKIDPNRAMRNYSSKIDEEAGRIRYWLRKRRVDVQTTKGIDD